MWHLSVLIEGVLCLILELRLFEGRLLAAAAGSRRKRLVSYQVWLLFGWSLDLHLHLIALRVSLLGHIGYLSLSDLNAIPIVVYGLSFGIDSEFLSGRG